MELAAGLWAGPRGPFAAGLYACAFLVIQGCPHWARCPRPFPFGDYRRCSRPGPATPRVLRRVPRCPPRVHPLGRGDHIRPHAFCVVGSGQRFPALQPPSKPGAAGTAQPGSGYLRGGGPFASAHAVTVAWIRGPMLHPPPQSTCIGRAPPWAGPPILCPAIQAQSACRASMMDHAHICTLAPTPWRHVWTFSVSVYHTYAIKCAV